MAMNRDFVGREYPSAEPYEVTRGKIREFAEAIQDPNPMYTDTDTARDAGYPDVIAPPTFPTILGMEGARQAIVDPELRLDFSMVVHSDQSFSYSRPLHAGDVLTSHTRISEIKALAGNEMLTLESEITTLDGEHVVTAVNKLVVRGGAENDEERGGGE